MGPLENEALPEELEGDGNPVQSAMLQERNIQGQCKEIVEGFHVSEQETLNTLDSPTG